MAIAHVGNIGTALSSANNQATLVMTTSAALEAGNAAVLIIAVDNVDAADGASSVVTQVQDSAGNNWQKATEYTNGAGAAQAGATCAIWYCKRATATLALGGTITATFANAALADASAMSAREYTISAGFELGIEGTPAGADGQASLNVTTTNIQCLRVRGVASESNSSTALTPTASWTIFTQAISGAGTSATEMGVRGEFIISTATGAASAPTGGAGAVDHASAYAAFKEVALPTNQDAMFLVL